MPAASASRTIGFALLGGFIGALIVGGIASMMPINGVPFFVAAVMMMGITGSMATAAGWLMHLITGLIIGERSSASWSSKSGSFGPTP